MIVPKPLTEHMTEWRTGEVRVLCACNHCTTAGPSVGGLVGVQARNGDVMVSVVRGCMGNLVVMWGPETVAMVEWMLRRAAIGHWGLKALFREDPENVGAYHFTWDAHGVRVSPGRYSLSDAMCLAMGLRSWLLHGQDRGTETRQQLLADLEAALCPLNDLESVL